MEPIIANITIVPRSSLTRSRNRKAPVARIARGRLLPSRLLLALLLPVVLVALGGCLRKPLEVKTSGRITADLPPVNTCGPIRPVTLRGGPCPSDGGRIALIDVDGLLLNMDMTGIYSMGENPVSLFREKLDVVACDPCVRGLVVRINTPGGGVTATDIMVNDLRRFKSKTQIPVVACLMDVATGGGYYLATAADQIIAHPTTVTGGIGVILNLYDLKDAMAQFNVIPLPIKSGQYLDLEATEIEPSIEGRQLLQDMADQFHDRFKKAVTDSRALSDTNTDELFDGRVFTASQAQQHGLIDSLGYLDEAIETARQLGGAPGATVAMYRRPNDPARSPYSITPNVPLQGTLFPISIPGLDRSRLPAFLYLWQPEPTLEKWGGR
jgi:protease-4